MGAQGTKASKRRAATASDGLARPSLDGDEIDYLAVNSPFTASEISSLWKLFHAVDADGSGRISASELLQMPQLAFNPLAERVVQRAFENRRRHQEEMLKQKAALGSLGLASGGTPSRAESASDEDLSFQDFVHVLSPFAPGASLDEKLRLAFAVYDFDGDGKLGEADLAELMRQLLPKGEEGIEKIIEQMVDMAIIEADKDGDGALDLQEFKKAVDKDDFRAKLTMVLE